MPEMSGMDVQRKMLDIAEHIPIIFISGHGDIPMAVKAIKAGAIDFLTKPFREEDLLCAIRTAINMIPKKEVTVAEIKDRYDSLSKREKEVIRFVLKGFLNKQTALELGISEATVKVHRHNIMRKMKTSSVQDLVRVCDRIESFYFDDCDNN